jgi:hypothetical protein
MADDEMEAAILAGFEQAFQTPDGDGTGILGPSIGEAARQVLQQHGGGGSPIVRAVQEGARQALEEQDSGSAVVRAVQEGARQALEEQDATPWTPSLDGIEGQDGPGAVEMPTPGYEPELGAVEMPAPAYEPESDFAYEDEPVLYDEPAGGESFEDY